MNERQLIVAGLQELYARLQDERGWPGEPLQKEEDGHPSIHEILTRLKILPSDKDVADDSHTTPMVGLPETRPGTLGIESPECGVSEIGILDPGLNQERRGSGDLPTLYEWWWAN
jgi:hypothetical protein